MVITNKTPSNFMNKYITHLFRQYVGKSLRSKNFHKKIKNLQISKFRRKKIVITSEFHTYAHIIIYIYCKKIPPSSV